MKDLTTETTPRRVVNLKALIIVIAAVVAVTIGVRKLHATQVVRTRDYLKGTAMEALEQKDHAKAFDLFEQYLTLNPNDDEVEGQIAILLEDHGKTSESLRRAFNINERLLLQDPSRDDLRMRQIVIADRLGQHADATAHLEKMRIAQPNQADVWYYSGLIERDAGNFQKAAEYFGKAVELPDVTPEAFEALADLRTAHFDDPQTARTLLDQMVIRKDSAESRRMRAEWLVEAKQPAAAIGDLWKALEVDPADAKTNALLLKSIRKARTLNPDFDSDTEHRRMVNHLNTQLLKDADQPKLRIYLSSALWATRQKLAAIRNLKFGITRDPRQFEMYEMLIDYLISDKKFDQAEALFQKIPVKAVDRSRHEFMRGRLLMTQKRWSEAIEAFELSIGFADKNPTIASRCRVCLALCRRESGDNDAALKSYASLIQTNPDFEGARLGIASAYLRADQAQLAIAEYQQLLHVDGVPPFLANLMIKHNLTLSPEQRDWQKIDDLVRDEDPLVKDPVQRSLLQADLLFAKGFPAQAMNHLDKASRRMPDRPEFKRAHGRLAGLHSEQLIERVKKVLKDNPRNNEAHISMVRVLVGRNDVSGLNDWFSELAEGRSYPMLSQLDRTELAALSATTVADSELLTRGPSETLQVLQKAATDSWRKLAGTNQRYLQPYVRFIGKHRSAQDAVAVANWVKSNATPALQSQCWLECLKVSQGNSGIQQRVTDELVALVRNRPDDMTLRLTYADSRIHLQQYRDAVNVLQSVVKFDSRNGLAWSRLAWVALMVDGDAVQASRLSERAAGLVPGNPQVLSIRGLALAETGNVKRGVEVVNAIAETDLTPSIRLFKARCLQLDKHKESAADLVHDLLEPVTLRQLPPAERRLLERLRSELNVNRQLTGL